VIRTRRKLRRRQKKLAKNKGIKTVFHSSYLSPLPVATTKIRCFGKPLSKHEKCYRVDQKTGVVIGRPTEHSPFVLHYHKNGKPIETVAIHQMEKKGFVEPEYDVKMAMWKAKKSKRVRVPAPIVSL